MARPNPVVHIKVSPLFFDKIFEPKRKEMEIKLGIRLTQPSFSEFIAKSNGYFNLPKSSNRFAPKKKKRGGLDFSLF